MSACAVCGNDISGEKVELASGQCLHNVFIRYLIYFNRIVQNASNVRLNVKMERLVIIMVIIFICAKNITN